MADPKAKVIIDADGNGAVREAQKVGKAYQKLRTDVDDAFTKGIAGAGSEVSDLAEQIGGMFAAFTNPTAAISTALLPALGALLGFGKAASDVSTNVEKSMADVWTLLDISREELDGLSGQVEQIALDLRRPPEMIANALYEWISANGRIDDGLQEFRDAVKAGVAGSTEAKVAVDGITTILNSYGEAAGSAAHVSDLMFQTVNKGKIRFEELASGIGLVISTAEGAQVPLEELMAAIATATAKGIRPSSAMEGIRSAISNIIKPSEQAIETAKILGIQWGAQALKAKGLAGLLADVRKATKGNVETMAQLFGDVSGLNVVLALSSENAQMFSDNLTLMQNSAGATDAAFAKQRDTMYEANQGADTLWQTLLKLFGDEINSKAKPFFKTLNDNSPTLIEHAKGLAQWFGEWLGKPWDVLDRVPGLFGDWAGSTASLYRAYKDLKDGDLLGFVKEMGTAGLSLMGTPFQAWISGFTTLKNKIEGLPEEWSAVTTWFAGLPSTLETNAANFKTWLEGKAPEWAAGFGKWTDNALTDTKAWFEGLGGNISGAVSTASTWLSTEIPKWSGAFGTWLSSSAEDISNWFLGLPAAQAEKVAYAAGWISGEVGKWRGAFTTWLDNSRTDITDWLTGLPDKTRAQIAGFGTWLGTEVPAKWTAFHDWLTGFETDAKGFFEGLPGRVTSWLQSAADAIPGLIPAFKQKGAELAASIWDGMRSSVEGFFAGAATKVQEIKDSVTGAFNAGKQAAGSPTGTTGSGKVGIPQHGAGGVFSDPHLAWIAERGETEAVVPKSQAADFLPLILEWAGLGGGRFGFSVPSVALAGAGAGLSLGGVTVIIQGGPSTNDPRAWGQAAGDAAGDAIFARLEREIKV